MLAPRFFAPLRMTGRRAQDDKHDWAPRAPAQSPRATRAGRPCTLRLGGPIGASGSTERGYARCRSVPEAVSHEGYRSARRPARRLNRSSSRGPPPFACRRTPRRTAPAHAPPSLVIIARPAQPAGKQKRPAPTAFADARDGSQERSETHQPPVPGSIAAERGPIEPKCAFGSPAVLAPLQRDRRPSALRPPLSRSLPFRNASVRCQGTALVIFHEIATSGEAISAERGRSTECTDGAVLRVGPPRALSAGRRARARARPGRRRPRPASRSSPPGAGLRRR